MKRRAPGLDPELEAFLEPRTIVPRAPADLRARALARGREIVAAGGAIPRLRLAELPAPTPVPAARGRGLFRIAFAALVAFAAGTVGAVAALRGRAIEAPRPAVQTKHATPIAGDVQVHERAPETPPIAVPEPPVTVKPPRATRAHLRADLVTAELELLQRAHAAYSRRDFSEALGLAAEHTRRFPNGNLAEQREALRVRSLAGSGRPEEARHAAAAFAVRFPRSVLLPRLADGKL